MAMLPKIIFSSSEEETESGIERPSTTDVILMKGDGKSAIPAVISSKRKEPDSPVFQPKKNSWLSFAKANYCIQILRKPVQCFRNMSFKDNSESTQFSEEAPVVSTHRPMGWVQQQLNYIKKCQETMLKMLKKGDDRQSIKSLFSEIKDVLSHVTKTLSDNKRQLKELHDSQRLDADSQLISSQVSNISESQSVTMKSAQRFLLQQKMLIKLFKVQRILSVKLNKNTGLAHIPHSSSGDSQQTQNFIKNLTNKSSNKTNEISKYSTHTVMDKKDPLDQQDEILQEQHKKQYDFLEKQHCSSLSLPQIERIQENKPQQQKHQLITNNVITAEKCQKKFGKVIQPKQQFSNEEPPKKQLEQQISITFSPMKALAATKSVKSKFVKSPTSNNILLQMLCAAIISPGCKVLSITFKGEQMYADIDSHGIIYTAAGKSFHSTEEWLYAVRNVKVTKQTSWRMVKYLGKPITSLLPKLKSYLHSLSKTTKEASSMKNSFVITTKCLTNVANSSTIDTKNTTSLNKGSPGSLTAEVVNVNSTSIVSRSTVGTNEQSALNTETELCSANTSSLKVVKERYSKSYVDFESSQCSVSPEKEIMSLPTKRILLFGERDFVKSSDILPERFWNFEGFENFIIDNEFLSNIGFLDNL